MNKWENRWAIRNEWELSDLYKKKGEWKKCQFSLGSSDSTEFNGFFFFLNM